MKKRNKNDDFEDILRYIGGPVEDYTVSPPLDRTYMPGYDLGDWLTSKEDTNLNYAIKVIGITAENPYRGFYNDDKDCSDLYIRFKQVAINPEADITIKSALRWNMYHAHDQAYLPYAQLLKEYRPLTDNEKLFYIKEEPDAPKKKASFTFEW